MNAQIRQHLHAFGRYLSRRRRVVLDAWHVATQGDPIQTTAHSLTRTQFQDHIPNILKTFENRLIKNPEQSDRDWSNFSNKPAGRKHGLHRWQQGYRLRELVHEWGHIQSCLFGELQRFSEENPAFPRAALTAANAVFVDLVNEAISFSAAQYEKMQQDEAKSRLYELNQALERIGNVERDRAALIQQAVHDLNGNILGVKIAAQILSAPRGLKAKDRQDYSRFVAEGMDFVVNILGDLRELARLESGQEHRVLKSFDVSSLLKKANSVFKPLAREKGLYLRGRIPKRLMVRGDENKTYRILQNLIVNALLYTVRGGVILGLSQSSTHWWLTVKDTGPGLAHSEANPLATRLEAGTSVAHSLKKDGAVPRKRAGKSPGHPPAPGNGIGLLIVKRLCDMLDASVEVTSSSRGTHFRILFPHVIASARRGKND